jgi:prepilin-type N-terminal cleavage/methylation domain-containing protein
MNNNKGFTLTELMAVVLIMVILVAVAMPLYINAVDRQKNVRAKAYLETINSGMERFHREYPNVELPDTGGVLVTPAANATCTYHGQTIGIGSNQLSIAEFLVQMIVCGYIPRYDYGTPTTSGNLDYVFKLQTDNSSYGCRINGNDTAYGDFYMEPKIYPSEDDKFWVGRKYCNQINYHDTNNNSTSTYCRYCAGVDNYGKAQDGTNKYWENYGQQ